MSLQRLVPVLMMALAASVAVVYLAAIKGDRTVSVGASAAFALFAVAVAMAINRAMWKGEAEWASDALEGADLAGPALRRNLRLLMLVYAWGALALMAAYPLAGLRWQHGWQYGLAMALIALALLVHVHRMEPGSPLRTPHAVRQASWITGLHALAAMAGVAFVLVSGKLGSPKGDWVANHVFVAGGLAVAVIGAMTLMTTRKLLPPGRS